MFISYRLKDLKKTITCVSNLEFETAGCVTIKVPDGTTYNVGDTYVPPPPAQATPIKVALICNWADQCGISTYSQYLADGLEKNGVNIKVFSERTCAESPGVVTCWKRGQSMVDAMKKVREWAPDHVIVQHEFGLFPVANHFLKLVELLDDYSYAVTFHSIYRHLDKTVCTSAPKNIVVHTPSAKQVLLETGCEAKIDIIHHPCIRYANPARIWDIFHNPYTVVQFGFGFQYKGVDVAIDAINTLKKRDKKYNKILYCYLCSSSKHFTNVHSNYYNYLRDKVSKLGLDDNVVILSKFNKEEILNNYLRICKVAIFPYIVNKDHQVFGASGATRIALANRIPTVCSDSSQFDDLAGVVPRPPNGSAVALADEISKLFNDGKHREALLAKQDKYVCTHTWAEGAKLYLQALQGLSIQQTA